MYMLIKTNLTIYMNKFQLSAHLALLIGERCVKGVDTSTVITAKVSAHGITLIRQSLDESGLAY